VTGVLRSTRGHLFISASVPEAVPASTKGDPKAIAAGLRKVALFAGLSDRQLKRLAQYVLVRDYPADAVVVRRGEKGAGFYLILDGQVQVRKGTKNIARLGPGEYFGELALFDNHPRSADVVTVGPSTFVVLSSWEFWGFARDRPEIMKTILQEMSRRLQETATVPEL
jgi:CRP/FNR family transcriptional regulator, cyclic AMP receptor protein